MRIFPTSAQRQYLHGLLCVPPPTLKSTSTSSAPPPDPKSPNPKPAPTAEPVESWPWWWLIVLLLLWIFHRADAAPRGGTPVVITHSGAAYMWFCFTVAAFTMLACWLLPFSRKRPLATRAKPPPPVCRRDRPDADQLRLVEEQADIPEATTVDHTPPPTEPPLDDPTECRDPPRLGFATHRGPVRRGNEDAGCVFSVGSHQVLVVADGVGGMKHGGDAAQIAVRAAKRSIQYAWRVAPQGQTPSPPMMITASFAAASSRLASSGLARGFTSSSDGLRTTLIVVIATEDRFHYGQIGDGALCVVRADGSVEPLLDLRNEFPTARGGLSATLGPTPHGAAVFGATERRGSDLLIATTDGVADRVLSVFYSKTLVREAHRNHGDLTATAESLLERLAEYRDEDMFTFDDNMTLALIGDRALPHEGPAQSTEGG